MSDAISTNMDIVIRYSEATTEEKGFLESIQLYFSQQIPIKYKERLWLITTVETWEDWDGPVYRVTGILQHD